MKESRFITGLIVTVIGFLISLTFFAVVVGVPLYLIGILLIVFSKKPLKTKTLYATFLVIFWWPGVWVVYTLTVARVLATTFLIPKNFRGKITVYYNEKCGIKPSKKDGRLIYNIPENGVLILQDELKEGILDNEYCLVDSEKNISVRLPELIQQDYNEDYTIEKNKHEPPRNRLGVFFGDTGESGIGANGNRTQAQTLFVGSWNRLRLQRETFTDSVTDSVLKSCRIKK